MSTCTVAIPVFNRVNLVGRAIESALAQDTASLEILMVDNHSTDGTWEAMQKYTSPKVRLYRNPTNLGLFQNFNRCMELATGEYIRFLCSDDQLLPNTLSSEIALLDGHRNVSLLSGRARLITEEGKQLGRHAHQLPAGVYKSEEAIATVLWFGVTYGQNPLNYPSGILIRRSAAQKAGAFRTDWEIAADMDFFFRVLRHGDLAIIDRDTCLLTVHSEQTGTSSGARGVLLQEREQLGREYIAAAQALNLDVAIEHRAPGWALWQAMALLKNGSFPGSEFRKRLRNAIAGRWLSALVGVAFLFFRRLGAHTSGRYRIPLKPLPFSSLPTRGIDDA